MKILILNWKDVKNPEVGGAEIIAFGFARRLVKDGHSITFFARKFKNCKSEEIIDGVKVVRRGGKLTVYLHAFFYYLSLRPKPDRVIDMVNTICWQTPLYVPYKKRFFYVNQLAKEVLFYEMAWPFSSIFYLIERLEYIFYSNTKTICYSKSTKEDLVSFGIKPSKISLFPMGLDHTRYKPGSKSKDPLFVFVARLVRMKRADLCIKAFKFVIEKYPKAKLAIIGNGPDEKRLEELVKSEKLQDQVIFVNKNNFFIDKNKEDIKVKLIQEAWAHLLPSVKEGWGMVVTEAAACATPSIVSDVTGLRDSVLGGKTGLVLSSNPNPEELSNAIIEIIENKRMRERMSKESVKWSMNFNWDKSYGEFKRIILA